MYVMAVSYSKRHACYTFLELSVPLCCIPISNIAWHSLKMDVSAHARTHARTHIGIFHRICERAPRFMDVRGKLAGWMAGLLTSHPNTCTRYVARPPLFLSLCTSTRIHSIHAWVYVYVYLLDMNFA